MSDNESSTKNEVSIILEEDDWHYVLAKLRKAIQPGCYEKSYCQLLEVIPKIENQLRKQR